jgi:sugar phosphate isomerase/epimerase
MKLACQESMAPGATLEEKVRSIEEAGYEGLEVWGSGLAGRVAEIKSAVKGTGVSVSTICAGYKGTPLSADPAERKQASDDIKELLDCAGALGAVGLIFVPIFGKPQLSDLSPWMTAEEAERALLVELMASWAEHAVKAGTLLLLEPLNRYETHLVKTLQHGTELCERVNNPKGLKIMADFFHMSIEERDIAAAIEAAGDWIAHIHLADSTRELPGYGHTDFESGFAALEKIGFEGYMALECGIPGEDKLAELTKSAQFLKAQMPNG